MKLRFFGAAGTVTGSNYLLEAGGTRLLVDCGMFQGRGLEEMNGQPFPYEPASAGALLLTHAHIDHSGRLPLLRKDGFRGRVFCTDATRELSRILLLDSAHLMAEDAEWRNGHLRPGERPVEPLFGQQDVDAALAGFQTVPYGAAFQPAGGVSVRFLDAGHILGSASAVVEAEGKRLVFSGDIGQKGAPVLRDPQVPEGADALLIESTYGDRLHGETNKKSTVFATGVAETWHRSAMEFAETVRETVGAGGNVLIPAFSVGRTQDLLYELTLLIRAREIPPVDIFVDSPLGTSATEIYLRHTECYDAESKALLLGGSDPLNPSGLRFARSREDSMALNGRREPAIIIAGSGMCNGGRILHHLRHNIGRRESAVVFVGFQAEGTLGRSLLEGRRTAHILGQEYDVRARVMKIDGFSAHADRNGLLEWLKGVREPPREVFVVHGEPGPAQSLRDAIVRETGLKASVAAMGQTVVV